MDGDDDGGRCGPVGLDQGPEQQGVRIVSKLISSVAVFGLFALSTTAAHAQFNLNPIVGNRNAVANFSRGVQSNVGGVPLNFNANVVRGNGNTAINLNGGLRTNVGGVPVNVNGNFIRGNGNRVVNSNTAPQFQSPPRQFLPQFQRFGQPAQGTFNVNDIRGNQNRVVNSGSGQPGLNLNFNRIRGNGNSIFNGN